MKNKSKKIVAFVSALSMLMLCACSSEIENNSTQTSNNSNTQINSSDDITLNLWHYYNGTTKDEFDSMIAEFNNTVGAEKNIKVESYSYSSVNDLATNVLAAANKEVGIPDMPHIFAAYTDTAMILDNMGMVASMDSYFSQEELALYQQDFLDEGRFDAMSNLKIIPVAKSTELLFINETDFAEFANETGVSMDTIQTWEGLAKVSEIYYNWTDAKTEESNDGSALFGVDSEANFLLVASKQLGEEMYNYGEDEVSFGLSESAGRKIWDTLLTPYIKGHFGEYGSYRSDDVKSGDILIYVGSTSSVNYFPSTVVKGKEDGYDIVGTAMAYPYFENGEEVVVQQGAGLVVAKNDEVYEKAASEFLKWFTSPENNLDFAVSTGYIPVQNEALSLEGVLGFADDNARNIVTTSLEVTYDKLLVEYEFYSNKPFDGSYDCRSAVADSMTDLIANAKENLALAETEEERAVILEMLISEEAFNVWYQGLEQEITDILS